MSYTKLASVILGSFYLLSNFAHFSFSDPFCSITQNKNITKCKKLTILEAEFGWNYQIHNKTFTQVDIFFSVRQRKEIRWLAWGVNPGNRPEMVGTRAIIGITQPNGTFEVRTYSITTSTKLGCVLLPSDIDLEVHNMNGDSNSEHITISATLILPDQVYNITRLNHVWQVGDHSADGLEPKRHPSSVQNFDSTETINLISGDSHKLGHNCRQLRKVHGILNIVGWGTILPIGVIVTRYYREYPYKWNYWFHFHVSCQIVGYILGTTGWAIGLWLGQASTKYTFSNHRLISIFIFTFTTLQMFALRLKPVRRDEYRKYWNVYHHFLGYALLALISVNIFQGIAILRSENKIWKWAYIGVLGILALVVLTFEVLTWTRFIKERKKEKNGRERYQHTSYFN